VYQSNLERFFGDCARSTLERVESDEDPKLAAVSLFQSVALEMQLARKQAMLAALEAPSEIPSARAD